MAELTTHVLDNHSGIPAAGVRIELYRIADGVPSLLKTLVTNVDGRVDGKVLTHGEAAMGTYELRFHMGDYFAGRGVALTEPRFLDIVPVRFGLADADAHYHVPLLASPWSYTTYRGS